MSTEAKTASETAQTASETAKSCSEAARNLAEKWATNTIGSQIPGTSEYSAKHYSACAEADRITVCSDKDDVHIARDLTIEYAGRNKDSAIPGHPGDYSGKHYMQYACDHKIAANCSRIDADTAKGVSEQWASRAKDSQIPGNPGKYSALHYQSHACNNMNDAISAKNLSKEWASNACGTKVSGTSEYSAKHYSTVSAEAKTASETAKTASETAKTASETAKTASETAKTASEKARDDSITAKTASETAKTASETAKTASEAAKTASETAKTASETAKTASEAAKTASETAKTASEAARDDSVTAKNLAKEWASKTTGQVEPGLYSAKYYTEETKTKHDAVMGTTVTSSVTTSAPGSNASLSYASGKFTFTVPRGDPLKINDRGDIAGRAAHDGEAEGYTYLATDKAKMYFKNSATSGDWSVGMPFGIELLDEDDFASNEAAKAPSQQSVKAYVDAVDSKVSAHTGSSSNPHSVTKNQIGLANVDNTSDSTKNSATAILTNKTIDSANNTITVTTSNISNFNAIIGTATQTAIDKSKEYALSMAVALG
jgi:chemotaxis protein histidine kinase CheA